MLNLRGYAAVALWNPKTPANVGGVLRAAGCYGADLVVVSGKRRELCLKRFATDTMDAWKHIPVLQPEDPFDALPFEATPIAVDLLSSATPLPRFVHPRTGLLCLWSRGWDASRYDTGSL